MIKVVTIGAIRHIKFQSNYHRQQTQHLHRHYPVTVPGMVVQNTQQYSDSAFQALQAAS